MSKWTPGPWSHVQQSNIANMIVGPNNGCVACVQAEYVSSKKYSELEAEAAANIRLIAEAPAMAELLERIVNSDMAQMAEDEGRVCAELSDARALLARLEAE